VSKTGESLQIYTQTPSFFTPQLSNPVVTTLTALIFIGLILVIIWPNESKSNIYQRQRKYARIDGLFLKVTASVFNELESKLYLKQDKLQKQIHSELNTSGQKEALFIVSLSCGGLSLESNRKIEKGQIIRINLHELPDFPTSSFCIFAKIVWNKLEPKENNLETWLCGAKFIFLNSSDEEKNLNTEIHSDSQKELQILRQYINYMMADLSL
jgi:PilZ domain